jgi:hypothetical protein
MSRIVIKSLRKQIEQVRHQPIQEHAQEQNEQQLQPMGIESVNASNMDATQRGKVNEQNQNVTKQVVQKDAIVLSTIHETPRTSTQLKVMNARNGDNHEPIHSFDEVVYVR